MWVPADAIDSGVLPQPSPILGSVDDIDRVAAYVQEAQHDSATFWSGVQVAQVQLQAGAGRAINTLHAKLRDRVVSGARKLNESADDAKRGFDAFAAEIDRIHARARGIVQDVESSLASIRTQAGTIDEIAQVIGAEAPADWATVPPGEMPTPRLGANAQSLSAVGQEGIRSTLHAQHSTQWLNAVVVWKQALDDIERARAQWETLVDDRKSAEKRLLRSLRDTDLGVLIAAGATGGWSSNENIAFGIAGEMRGVEIRVDGTPNPAVDALLEEGLTGVALAEAWQALGLSREEIEALPIRTLAQLATCDGLPAWVQDIASVELLHYALVAPDQARDLLGLGGSELTVEELHTQVLRLHSAWQEAKAESRRLEGAPAVQLLALGSHDGALTAAISHGDLDTASSVGVNVSGMDSGVGTIGYDSKAGRVLYNEAQLFDQSQDFAVVTWIGYRSPDVADVNLMHRANAGGPELASFLDGIVDSRGAHAASAPSLTVFAHSYGSTTAAVGLAQAEHPIDSLVMYGSAGVGWDTSVANIKAEQVFAAHASGDQLAYLGRLGTHFRDPRTLPGVIQMPVDGAEGYPPITSHDLMTVDDAPSPMNWRGKTGYFMEGTRFAELSGQILANGGL